MANAAMARSLLSLALMCMLIINFSHLGHAQIPCPTVDSDLLPCANYVMNGGTLPPACCSGFNGIVSLAKTQADRQSVCNCVKTFLANANDGQINNAARIPPLCGVDLHFNISRNMDCSKVNVA